MKIFISIVSHGHGKMIENLGVVRQLSKSDIVEIVVRDNVGELDLAYFCRSIGVAYECNLTTLGFGENNNLNFQLLKDRFNLEVDDLFLVLNPDVIVEKDDVLAVWESMCLRNARVGTCNLFLDRDHNVFDDSVRRFPKFWDFVKSYVFKRNPAVVDKSSIAGPTFVDWAAGSFLLFNSGFYEKLSGFDSGFFMYCEDIDICYRAKRLGEPGVLYVPQVHAVHLAKKQSRKIWSKHFIWHLGSIFRYLRKTWGVVR